MFFLALLLAGKRGAGSEVIYAGISRACTQSREVRGLPTLREIGKALPESDGIEGLAQVKGKRLTRLEAATAGVPALQVFHFNIETLGDQVQ